MPTKLNWMSTALRTQELEVRVLWWAPVGVATLVEQEVVDKIRELGDLMEHATPADAHKAPEMSRWFDAYFARATPGEARAVRAAVRKLWPRCAILLMGQAESKDPKTAAAALRDLEAMTSLRCGGKN